MGIHPSDVCSSDLVSRYGGGTFLLPYFFFVIIIGLSGVIGEMSFGRAARSGPMGAFGYAAARRLNNRRLGAAIGCIPVIGSLALAIGYSVIVDTQILRGRIYRNSPWA